MVTARCKYANITWLTRGMAWGASSDRPIGISSVIRSEYKLSGFAVLALAASPFPEPKYFEERVTLTHSQTIRAQTNTQIQNILKEHLKDRLQDAKIHFLRRKDYVSMICNTSSRSSSRSRDRSIARSFDKSFDDFLDRSFTIVFDRAHLRLLKDMMFMLSNFCIWFPNHFQKYDVDLLGPCAPT